VVVVEFSAIPVGDGERGSGAATPVGRDQRAAK